MTNKALGEFGFVPGPETWDVVPPTTDTEVISKFDLVRGALGEIALPDRPFVVDSHSMHFTKGPLTISATPDKVFDSTRSAHQVALGRITRRDATKASGSRTVLNVAIKPFGDIKHAVREASGYSIFQHHGVETYDPVAVLPTRSGHHAVLTVKRDDFMSLDRDDFVPAMAVRSAEDAETLERNIRTVREVAENFARLHMHGVFHPDGQVKNWAVTSTGTIGPIDTENVNVRPLLDSDTVGLAWGDIEKFVKSLVMKNSTEDKIFGVGLFADLPQSSLVQASETYFMQPYEEALVSEALDLGQPELQRQAELLYTGIRDRYSSEVNASNWPSSLIK